MVPVDGWTRREERHCHHRRLSVDQLVGQVVVVVVVCPCGSTSCPGTSLSSLSLLLSVHAPAGWPSHCCHRLSLCQLGARVIVVIVVCPCSSTGCPGMSSSLPSVHAPAGWSSHRPRLSRGSSLPSSSPSGGISIVCALVVAELSFLHWKEQLNVQSIQARTHLCHLGHSEVPEMHPYGIVSDAEDWSNLQISVHMLNGLSSWSWLCVIAY